MLTLMAKQTPLLQNVNTFKSGFSKLSFCVQIFWQTFFCSSLSLSPALSSTKIDGFALILSLFGRLKTHFKTDFYF
jgi:hypothetical protein